MPVPTMPAVNGHATLPGSITSQLVLGSMERADEYQRLLTSLKESAGSQGKVQGEMVDRILDNGESLVQFPSDPPFSRL